MGLVSFKEDITERRVQDRARIMFEDCTYYAESDCKLSPKGEELAEMAESLGTTRQKLIALRRWAQETTKTSLERLAREKTIIYTLNEPRDRVLTAQYVSTGEAAEIGRAVPGDLLSLDDVYGGVLVRDRYIFVSELAFKEGQKKYEPDSLLSGLFQERLAA